jgi:hypothetical protein
MMIDLNILIDPRDVIIGFEVGVDTTDPIQLKPTGPNRNREFGSVLYGSRVETGQNAGPTG